VVAKIFAILFVVLGIGTALWLIRNPQIFQPKATETADISFESHYNPFGDPWASNIATNPSIPVTLTTGCYRRGPKWTGRETDPNVSDEEINHLAKSNTGLVFEECASLQGPNSGLNRQRLINIATKLKQKNPNAKFIGYHVFWMIDFDPQFSTDIYTKAESDQMCGGAKCESFFIHKKGLSATRANRIGHYLDITNPYYRQYIAPKVAQALTEMNMDGFLADGVAPFLPGVDNNLIPDDIRNNWSASWPDLLRDVKAAIGPNKLLFVNSGGQGINFSRSMITSDGNSPRADGLMWEDPLGPLGVDLAASGRLSEINGMLDMVSSLNKYLMIVVNTNVNCSNSSGQPVRFCYDQTNKSQQNSFQKYYLSAYLNLFRNNKTTLVYYHPLITSPQFDSEAFYRDWNLKIGQPTTGMQEVSQGVYLRKFQNAWVYWNNSNGGYTASGAGLYNLNGTLASQHSIPSKSGAIYVTQAVLTDWNQPPAVPSPSPSPVNQISMTAFSECYGQYPAINIDFGDIGKEYTVEISPAVKGVGATNGAIPGRLTLRPLRIYDAGINGIRALSLNTTYSFYILATSGERSNTVTVTTPASCTLPSPSPSPVVIQSPSPATTARPDIIAESSSSYCIGNATRVHLQWQSVPGAVLYKVFKIGSDVNTGTNIGETSGIAFNEENVAQGQSHQYRIAAMFANGSSTLGERYSLTSSICPQPSPSASTVRKVGDIDNNGRIDIFDFNLLVQDFRVFSARSDLNSDNKVDIFDFNLLITNFGR
jgi:hypothetical protein